MSEQKNSSEVEPTQVLKELEKNILITKHLFDNVLALGKILKMKEKGMNPLNKNYQFFNLRNKFITNITQDIFEIVKKGLKDFREQSKPFFNDSNLPNLHNSNDISDLVKKEVEQSPLQLGFNSQPPLNQFQRDVDNLHDILDDKINQLMTIEPENDDLKTKFVITELKNLGNYLTSKSGIEPFEIDPANSNNVSFSQLKEDFGLFNLDETPNWDYGQHVGEFEYLSGVKEFGFFYDGETLSAGLHHSRKSLVPRNTAVNGNNLLKSGEKTGHMSFEPESMKSESLLNEQPQKENSNKETKKSSQNKVQPEESSSRRDKPRVERSGSKRQKSYSRSRTPIRQDPNQNISTLSSRKELFQRQSIHSKSNPNPEISKYSKSEKLETSGREEPELLLAHSPNSKIQSKYSDEISQKPEILQAVTPTKYSEARDRSKQSKLGRLSNKKSNSRGINDSSQLGKSINVPLKKVQPQNQYSEFHQISENTYSYETNSKFRKPKTYSQSSKPINIQPGLSNHKTQNPSENYSNRDNGLPKTELPRSKISNQAENGVEEAFDPNRRNTNGFRTVNIQNLIPEDNSYVEGENFNIQQPARSSKNQSSKAYIMDVKEYKLEDRLERKFKGILILLPSLLTLLRAGHHYDRR